jgi:formylglycine-generating enzyme required for sulfatase activity
MVTNSQYQLFRDQNPRKRKPKYWDDRRFNQAHQPAVGISSDDTVVYFQWADCRLERTVGSVTPV